MPAPAIARSALLIFAGTSSACLISQESVEYRESSRPTETYSGFTPYAGDTVEVQVLTSLDKEPTDPSATWSTIASGVSGTSVAATSGGTDYYAYNISAFPPGVAAWPQGGVARIRVRHGGDKNGFVFDDLSCILEDPTEDWDERAVRCQSKIGGAIVHFVDGTPIAASGSDYISLRETPNTGGATPGLDYYAKIDPLGKRATLAGFKTTNGFGRAFPFPEVNARYFNKGDLELGRDMHCKKQFGGKSACYVTNYGDPSAALPGPGDDPHASLAATIARDAAGLVATVAMEFRGGTGADAITFYAYGPGGSRVDEVVLDSEGLKGIPGACLSCHGGTYSASTHSVTGAKYLPFDVQNFSYSGSSPYRLADQQAAFRKLNELVYDGGATAPTKELIEGWYGTVGTRPDFTASGSNQDTDFVPAGWAGKELLYKEVVAPYCRGCHVAVFDGSGGFDTFSDFESRSGSIELYTCDSKIMPHAEVTRNNFWQSGARGYLIGGLDLPTACN